MIQGEKFPKVDTKEKMQNQEDFKDFLLTEFQQSFEHMRHYDNMRVAMLRFAFSFYSLFFALIGVLLRLSENHINEISLYASLFVCLLFLIGVGIYKMLLQNRKYFVLTARQVNSIRGFFLKNKQFLSVLPVSKETPKFLNFQSVHIQSILLIDVLNSSFVAIATYFFTLYVKSKDPFPWLLLAFGLSFIVHFLFLKFYLKEK